MLKKIIIIEGEKDYQCDTLEEIVKKIIDEKFYKLSEKEKKEKLSMLSIANTIGQKNEIVENINNLDINNNFIIKDEFTYILSLLTINKITILERRDSTIFNKFIELPNTENNYININKFAFDIMIKYLKIS